jgi:hypothetical protein
MSMIKRAREMKPKVAIGKLGELGAGVHKVVIKKVMLQDYTTKGFLEIVVENITGASHRERLWPIDQRDPSSFSTGFVNLINAVFSDPDIYDTIESIAGDSKLEHVFYRALEGSEVKVAIERGRGVAPEKYNEGWVLREYPSLAVWEDDNGPVVFASYRDVTELVRAEGLTRSFCRITEWSSVSDTVADANRAKFDKHIDGMAAAAKQLGDTRKLFNPSVFK